MASISVGTKTINSVEVYLSGLDTSWENGTRTVYWYLGSANGGIPTANSYFKTKSATISDGVSSGGNVTFSGLQSGTQYGVYCEVYHNSELLTSKQGYVTTNTGSSVIIPTWYWYRSNGSASATQTEAALNAIQNKRSTLNFSHLVWNDIVNKAKAISNLAVGWWDSDYATYSDTLMTTEPYELTADMFNSLRNNLEIIAQYVGMGYKTGIGKVSPGDKVYGDYFDTLTEYMNDCIVWLKDA